MSEHSTTTEVRYLGYNQAAKYLGVSIGTLRRWVESGKVHAYRVGERLCRFDREELDRLVKLGDGEAVIHD